MDTEYYRKLMVEYSELINEYTEKIEKIDSYNIKISSCKPILNELISTCKEASNEVENKVILNTNKKSFDDGKLEELSLEFNSILRDLIECQNAITKKMEEYEEEREENQKRYDEAYRNYITRQV